MAKTKKLKLSLRDAYDIYQLLMHAVDKKRAEKILAPWDDSEYAKERQQELINNISDYLDEDAT
jgi:hypothetical protein